MGGLDPAKLLVILVLALVLLGPERLPRAARQVGAFWRDFTVFRERLENEVRSAMPDVDLPNIPVLSRSGLTGYLTGMMREADRGGAGATKDGELDGGEVDEPGAGSFAPGQGGAAEAAWQSPSGGAYAGNPSPVLAPNGIPAGWHSAGAEAPGYASGSLLSPVPVGAPEAILGAEARLDLDDPSWN